LAPGPQLRSAAQGSRHRPPVGHLAALLLGFPLSFTGSIKLILLSSVGHVLPCGRRAEAPVPNVDQGRGLSLPAAFCRAVDIHFQRCHNVPLHASFDEAALAGRKLTLVRLLGAVARCLAVIQFCPWLSFSHVGVSPTGLSTKSSSGLCSNLLDQSSVVCIVSLVLRNSKEN
jgi:hypothetical protein